MTNTKLFDEIKEIPIFDTHTHLIGDSLEAENFWKIGHYFWFLRELQAAGYPQEPEKLDEAERRKAYIKAFNATRNTSMNWVVRHIFKDLYGIEITNEDSIKKADEAVRSTTQSVEWPRKVIDKIGVKKIVVNHEKHANFQGLTDVSVILPRIEGQFSQWVKEIDNSSNQKEQAEEVVKNINKLIGKFKDNNHSGLMISLDRFNLKTYDQGKELEKSNNTKDEIIVFLLHKLCQAASDNDLFIQLFLGMEKWSTIPTSANDPERIIKLHGLFEEYDCDFELVLASEINNMDVVQAARMFTNVYVGGLWWFNFRASTYRECMQKRFEALPPSKSSLVVSDARCIEWCYGKNLLIKKLMAEFLTEKINAGWIDQKEALRVAREWLYGSADSRY